ncbi:MAG: hypothetical protein H7A01_08660 [Hahellaceae bacterium]|nr:hypothetical protein [Hahellaceae bacterium]MCP5211458.1 hypothetical protein [Hahellaceae bacterium]
MSKPGLIIHFSEQSLAQIIASSLEAFVIPHETELSHYTGIETFMTLWGSETQTAEISCINVAFAIPSTSAERDYSSVSPSHPASMVKRDFITAYFPQYQLIGDIHTHPYIRGRSKNVTPARIREEQLYALSPADIESCLIDPVDKMASGYRVSAVLTMTDMLKENTTLDGQLANNVIEFSLNNYKCWLTCSGFHYIPVDGLSSADQELFATDPQCEEGGIVMVLTDDVRIHAPALLGLVEHQPFGSVTGKRKLRHVEG